MFIIIYKDKKIPARLSHYPGQTFSSSITRSPVSFKLQNSLGEHFTPTWVSCRLEDIIITHSTSFAGMKKKYFIKLLPLISPVI